MKKWMCVFLAMAILFASFGALAPVSYAEAAEDDEDTDLIEFDTPITNAMDNSATEWFSSGQMRALLTVLITAELQGAMDVEDVSLDLTHPTYVGYIPEAFSLIVVGWNEDYTQLFNIYYTPLLEMARYGVHDVDASAYSDTVRDLLVTGAVSAGGGELIKNEMIDLLTVTKALKEILLDD